MGCSLGSLRVALKKVACHGLRGHNVTGRRQAHTMDKSEIRHRSKVTRRNVIVMQARLCMLGQGLKSSQNGERERERDG